MSAKERILIVEDEEFVLASLIAVLEAEGFEPVTASSVPEALEVLAREPVDLVISDLRLPGAEGIELLKSQQELPPVVMITGHGTVDDAVEAMKRGAYDFLQKPIDPEQLCLVARRALEHDRVVGELRRLRDSTERARSARSLVGGSAAMSAVRELVEQVAPTHATVLVRGESGTGKELVAAELHRLGQRPKGPLVLVNCAAVPSSLFESEFFGHRMGAFSGAHADRYGRFAEASGGTLVLDEVHTLALGDQAKLLRVLETGEYQMLGESRTRTVDTRIVAVTNTKLEERLADGSFRSDLFYRLNVFPIDVPPLREHKEDLGELVDELMRRSNFETLGGSAELGADALAVLRGYDWPGNVRELRNLLERAAILAPPNSARRLDAELLRRLLGPTSQTVPKEGSLCLRDRLEETEREVIRAALLQTEGRKKEAAELLGIDPKNMSYHLKKVGLSEWTP